MKCRSRVRRYLVCLTLCCLAGLAQAAEEYAGEFLTLGVGARALALGGSYAALADDATAAYWNPAGLGGLRRSEASFMHSSLFGLDSYDFANYVDQGRLGGVLAVSWLRVGVSDIPQTELSNLHQPVGTTNRPRIRQLFSVSQNAFLLSYGRSLMESERAELQIGGSTKLLYLTGFGNTNGLGVGVDLGGLGRLDLGETHRLSAGLVLRDLLRTKIHWNTPPATDGETPYSDTIPPTVVVALALEGPMPGIGGQLALALDGDSRNGWEWHTGAEYVLAELLAFRAGLQERRGAETRWDFTAGTGLRLAFVTGAAFVVDYAFTSSELGPSHRVSLGLRL